MKNCILGLKSVCDNCGACEDERCELDPDKLCDNCFKCLDITDSYREIPIGRILMEGNGDTSLYVLDLNEQMEAEMDITEDQGDSTGAPDDLEWDQ